jgi:hypothetical protein
VDSFENSLVFCRKHYKIVDSNEDRYPPERLRAWKANHDISHAVRNSCI